MARLDVFRLEPRGAFHFGTTGIGIEETAERCPSDTIYAALLIEGLRAGSFDEMPVDPPFRLSSCFPFAGDALLFPVPRLAPRWRIEQQGERKRLKDLRYVSETILRSLLAGEPLQRYVTDGWSPCAHEYQGGVVLIAEGDGGPSMLELWDDGAVDHVTVDRVQVASQYYAVGQVRYAPDCGLYVLAQCRDTPARNLLLELLIRLGHAGLGGRRSGGLGQFEARYWRSIVLPDCEDNGRAMLLSRYLPTQTELQGGVLQPDAAYTIVPVGGWFQSTGVQSLQRKVIHLLTEGSIVRCINGQAPQGWVADVRPDREANAQPDELVVPHPVWRYGLALAIGVTNWEG